MAIAAGVVGYPHGTTLVSFLHMTAQGRCAADLDGPHCLQMPQGHLMSMGWPEGRPVCPKNISYFNKASHQKPLLLWGRLLIAGQKIDGAFYLPKISSCDMKIGGCRLCCDMTQKTLDVVEIGAGFE